MAKIKNLGTVLPSDKDVSRLDVSMNDAFGTVEQAAVAFGS
jgi:hypothetical protein